MGSRGEGPALALLRVALGLLWLQDLVLPRLAPDGWLTRALDLPPGADWVLPAVELALVALLLTGLLVRLAAAVGAALGVAGALQVEAAATAGDSGAWAVVLLVVAHGTLVVGGGSWGALDAVRRSGDLAAAVRLGRAWGLLALAAGVTGVVVSGRSQPRWTAEHTLALSDGAVSLGTWDLPGMLAVGAAGLLLLTATVSRMAPMALVALLVAGAGAVLVVLGVFAGGVASASLLAALAVVAAVCASRLGGAGGEAPSEDWAGDDEG